MSDVKPVAIVTAASKGIGAAAAARLARDGYHVALMARSAAINDLAAELGGLAVQGSVTEAHDLHALVQQTLERWGRVDAVVCNTGAAPRGPVLSISDEEWQDGMEITFLHAVRLARLVQPIISANGGGAIVNISSFAAREPTGRFPVSSVMRAGLAAFTKLFVEEHAASGIRMNNVLPGYIENSPEPNDLLVRIPARRLGALDEIAATIAFLLSPSAAYINGQNITVDGGFVRAI